MDIAWKITHAAALGDDATEITVEYRADDVSAGEETFAISNADAEDADRLAAEMTGHSLALARRLAPQSGPRVDPAELVGLSGSVKADG